MPGPAFRPARPDHHAYWSLHVSGCPYAGRKKGASVNSARSFVTVLVTSVMLTLVTWIGAVASPAGAAGVADTVSTGGASLGRATTDDASSIWSVEATVSQKPKQVNNSYFGSVSASGPDEAWAVGIYGDENALDHPLAEHWNGTCWSIVPVPQPTGQRATFDAVDDLSPDDA